jgi:hypothetical protein
MARTVYPARRAGVWKVKLTRKVRERGVSQQRHYIRAPPPSRLR